MNSNRQDGLFGFQSKVAIPRLAGQERPPSKIHTKHRDRVQRACRNCHKRKVKCSGGLPRCTFCEKVNKPCIYEATRKDRLLTATDRNEHLVSLLRDLSVRVDDEDRSRIESALNDSDFDDDSPEPSSAGGSSRMQATSSYIQRSERSRPSQASPSNTLFAAAAGSTSPAVDVRSSFGHLESSYDVDILSDEVTQAFDAHNDEFWGQMCEAQWLKSLFGRIQVRHHSDSAWGPHIRDTNYYPENGSNQHVDQENPFLLPPENLATVLFQCYSQTVQVSFSIIPLSFQHQVQAYYHSARAATSVDFPPSWYATVNLVLAIGARFSHLINAEWHCDPLDEIVYLSRAYLLMGLNGMFMMPATPDLPLIQAFGLLSFYYLTIGRLNKAWLSIGTAMRLAVAFGLHAQTHSSPNDGEQRDMVQTWWSLHNLESLLSTMTGRPYMLRNEDITTPLPSEVADTHHQQDNSILTSAMTFPDAQVRLAVIAQETLSLLYIKRRTPRSWAQTHAIITSMTAELDEWALEAMPQHPEGSQVTNESTIQQTLLKKQYCRVKILIVRPSLRRIERCLETSTNDYTRFDYEVAETCIQTAQDVVGLLPDDVDLRLVYENGPWWAIIHNIMQSLAILLIGISCRRLFESSYAESVAGVKKLVTWLLCMRDTNDIAKRAYQVVYGIVMAPNLVNAFVWADIRSAFQGEGEGQGEGQMMSSMGSRGHVPWAREEQPLQRLFWAHDAR